MKIYIGADHAGYKLKEQLKKRLRNAIDITPAYIEGDDYPEVAEKVAKKVAREKSAKGVLVCGSGEGVCIAANKIKGIRAVTCFNEKIAVLSREHNDANVLCLSGWALSGGKAAKIVKKWLATPFSGAARHKRRIRKISALER